MYILSNSIKQRINLLDLNRESRISRLGTNFGDVVFGLDAQMRQILMQSRHHIFTQIGVRGRACEGGTGKLRTEVKLTMTLGAVGYQTQILRAQRINIITILRLVDIKRAAHLVEVATHCVHLGIECKVREGISLIHIHRIKVGIINLQVEIIHRTVAIQIGLALESKLQRSTITRHLTRKALVVDCSRYPQIGIVAVVEIKLTNLAPDPTSDARL